MLAGRFDALTRPRTGDAVLPATIPVGRLLADAAILLLRDRQFHRLCLRRFHYKTFYIKQMMMHFMPMYAQ